MAAESVNLASLVRCTLEISAAHYYLLIAKIAYGALKNLKISGHIAISPDQVRCTSTFYAAMVYCIPLIQLHIY